MLTSWNWMWGCNGWSVITTSHKLFCIFKQKMFFWHFKCCRNGLVWRSEARYCPHLQVKWIWLRWLIKKLEGWNVVVMCGNWRVFWPIWAMEGERGNTELMTVESSIHLIGQNSHKCFRITNTFLPPVRHFSIHLSYWRQKKHILKCQNKTLMQSVKTPSN